MTELAHFTARGHPALRASHAKTLEFTADPEVTGRATCVLGVSSSLPPAPVAGPIQLTVSVGTSSITLDALGNSAWQPGRSAVLRRSRLRRPDTFATDASLAAADLPRSFTALLADPQARVEVAVSRRPAEPALIRFRLYPACEPRLRSEADAADQVRAEDAGARSWLAVAGIAIGGRPGGRTLSVSSVPFLFRFPGASPDTPGSPDSADTADTADTADELIGWPAEVAVVAAGADPAPSILALGARPAEISLIAAAHPEAGVVFRAEVADLAKLLSQAGRPSASLVLVAADDPERPVFSTAGEAKAPERGDVVGRLGPAAGAGSAPPVEPGAFVRNLLDQGVTARTVALALTALPGWSRRSAYDFVLALQG